ncbi:kinase inhibitor [Budviciaceae bacterium BWR-B9]|uniref:Kinase inhibitor n=1 Tax=Limnobaculum allomyrinae TaxID=2791986 RepID=A0ABS1IKQ8_9GAMM|nr:MULTISPECIES: kinase inhibitor [Limnobaculum]MBK5142331.1 kinase inhibitor [Limnobaculum allomyrinae]MBV7690784.1 kinase inhibitor [Limnobaculum sp. M2-1]
MNKYTGIAALMLVSLSVQAGEFHLTSNEIKSDVQLSDSLVFQGFGCDGGNKSPSLVWSGAPEGTKSFAVTVFDPDAPTGSGWWHWTVVNIPATVNSLMADAGNQQNAKLPGGAVQGRNDFGYAGFGGACPPKGDRPHHYHFKVWALKTESLPIDNDSSGALVGFMLNANKLATAEIVPVYGR